MIEIPKFELNNDEPKIVDYSAMHVNSVIDLYKKPERPPLAISIGLDDKEYKGVRYPLRFGTFGNISMIKGEEKARKSWLKSLILACAMGGNSYNYSDIIKGHNLTDKFIIDIDTEQDVYDNWMSANRLPQMFGTIDKPILPENYIPINLREYSANDIKGYLEWLFMQSEYRNKLGVVSIDGYVDCVNDFNNQTESIEFTRSLMRYSSLTKSHITGVLHLNPNSEKARGHLGTILQQKCETVVIIKDEGSYSLVTCQRGRGKKFNQFGISVDNDWLPYEVNQNLPENWH
jgi:hypothetical protein